MAGSKLGRIKGVNSDYRYEGGKIIEVKPEPADVDLSIFLCPNRMPSSIEEPLEDASGSVAKYCDGHSQSCPGATKQGHALLHLHQSKGIGLVTNGARVQVSQAGGIELRGEVLNYGPLRVQGDLVVRTEDGVELRLESRPAGISLVGPAGARVSFGPSGAIALTPGTGSRVEVHGDLEVKGVLIAEGPSVPGGAELKEPSGGTI